LDIPTFVSYLVKNGLVYRRFYFDFPSLPDLGVHSRFHRLGITARLTLTFIREVKKRK